MTTEINYHALLERARNKVQSIEFALTQSAFAEIRAELENDLETGTDCTGISGS